ncbi:SCP2 domain-containing protein [Corallincola platygyrae]|uniref:Ubiquinone biosynthesis accessory factor UbiT n=1 Tax=Corallincola platygyrae TaxID=1193278 RepID=A0ABW4XIA0_9GAMM
MLPIRIRHWIVSNGPTLASRPLNLTPFALYRPLIDQLLKTLLAEPITEGELDFLEGRWLQVSISDLNLSFAVSVNQGQLCVSRQRTDSDVCFSAEFNDLLLVAARRQDPDTLFFQRKLDISGDTELGLEVKNLLASLDMEVLPAWMQKSTQNAANWVEQAREHDKKVMQPA